jgi:hydrogenase expression/formation protein HypC
MDVLMPACSLHDARLRRSARVVAWIDPLCDSEESAVCLAIPGQIVDVVDATNHLAKVEVAGVQRTVNVGLFDDLEPGDWILIHVGFAISKIDEDEARSTLALLAAMGAEYETELEEL